MIIGKKFYPELVKKKYDVIIIGSGISGLTLANLQAKQGRSVLVLEKHYTAGGCTHTYKKKGYDWDVGLHYVGDVHHENHPFRKIFDFISDNNLKWKAMPEDYDQFVYAGKKYKFLAGRENLKKELLKDFPSENEALEKYLNLIGKMSKTLSRISLCKIMPKPLAKLILKYNNTEYFHKSTYDVLKELELSEDLINVLCGQWGDYGVPPKQSSFGVHGVVAHHYLNGAAFPIGGSIEVAKTIVQSIVDNHGEVIIGKGVAKVLIKNNSAYAVLLDSGEMIEGKEIVSSIGAPQSYLKFFDQNILPNDLKEKIGKSKLSVSYLSLVIGIDKPSSILNHSGGNIWIYPNINHDKNYLSYFKDPYNNQPPMIYLSFPTLKDPLSMEHTGDKTSINILGVAAYEWFEKWDATTVRKRPEEYKEFKELLVKPYFDALYREFPQLKDQISYYEISTPLTVNHYLNYMRGEIYGLDLGPERFYETWLTPKTPIKNFYLTGQDIVINGVCGGMMSGILTSTAMHPLDTIVQLGPLGVLT